MLYRLARLGSIPLVCACSTPPATVIQVCGTGTTPSGGNGGSGTLVGSTASTGGSGQLGGAASTGGNAQLGGASASTGGNAQLGGATASGGTACTGGNTQLGGGTASGGSNATSPSPATGGSSTTSTRTTGGAPATGGSSAAALGGTDAAGHPAPPYLFPQNYRSPNCTYPSAVHAQDAKAAFATWKSKLITSDGAGGFERVQRPDNENNATNTTVSEGIGYGMILAVIMDEQTLFDNLWNYSQIHLNGNGLMIWLIDSDGNPGVEDTSTNKLAGGSATDGDEDMAWALAMAAQKWGGHGSLTKDYATLAKDQIGRIWSSEVDHSGLNLINAGDSWGTTFAWNPSYFAPNEYRLFAKLDTANTAGWTSIITKGYTVLAASQNASTGLFPAWTDTSGAPSAPWSGAPTNYQYDAARVPFRIGLDYCDNGESRAKTLLAKTSAFFSNLGASAIVDGYSLTGTPTPENTTPTGVQSALFVGAAGVGAMSDATYQSFVSAVYTQLVTQPDNLMLPKSYYYNLSWKVFSLLMMSGNLFDYTLHT